MKEHHSLTDEQFADLLAGRPTEEALAHLHGKADAELELDDLKSALRSYRSETLAWAERRSATAPSLASAARRRARWMAVPQWSLAAIAVATVAVGIGHLPGRSGDDAVVNAPVATAVAGTQSAVASRPIDIASDNELLTSIDVALSSRGALPVDGLGLKPASDESADRHNVE